MSTGASIDITSLARIFYFLDVSVLGTVFSILFHAARGTFWMKSFLRKSFCIYIEISRKYSINFLIVFEKSKQVVETAINMSRGAFPGKNVWRKCQKKQSRKKHSKFWPKFLVPTGLSEQHSFGSQTFHTSGDIFQQFFRNSFCAHKGPFWHFEWNCFF